MKSEDAAFAKKCACQLEYFSSKKMMLVILYCRVLATLLISA